MSLLVQEAACKPYSHTVSEALGLHGPNDINKRAKLYRGGSRSYRPETQCQVRFLNSNCTWSRTVCFIAQYSWSRKKQKKTGHHSRKQKINLYPRFSYSDCRQTQTILLSNSLDAYSPFPGSQYLAGKQAHVCTGIWVCSRSFEVSYLYAFLSYSQNFWSYPFPGKKSSLLSKPWRKNKSHLSLW